MNDPAALDELLRALPPCRPGATPVVERLFSVRIAPASARPGLRSYHLLYADHVRVARTLDRKELVLALARSARLFVAERARHRVFVHAGAVGWRGKAIVVPGRSMSGKSTLVAELVRAGATYLSDEFAVLDARGLVHPFAKPISLRRPGETSQVDVAPETLGEIASEPLPLGLVVATRFRPRGRFRPRALSPGEGVLALLSHTVVARRAPARALRVLERASRTARVVRTSRGEAREVAELVLALSEQAATRPA